MGGDALKNVSTRRYTRTEYFLLKERILNKLQGHLMFQKSFHLKIRSAILTFFSIKYRHSNEFFHPTEIVMFIHLMLNNFKFSRRRTTSYSDLRGLIGNICQKITVFG